MNIKEISEDYIAGFVDGEGCFALSIRKDVRNEIKSKPVYYSWKAFFVICLRSDDTIILQAIREKISCGSITYSNKGNSVRYQVSNIDDLEQKIIPFFKKNKLFGKKGKDFELWTNAIEILSKYKKLRQLINFSNQKKITKGFSKVPWDREDIIKINQIENQIKKYKSKRSLKKWSAKSLGRGSKASLIKCVQYIFCEEAIGGKECLLNKSAFKKFLYFLLIKMF